MCLQLATRNANILTLCLPVCSPHVLLQDKQAAKLLKNTSVEEMIAMSIRNKEQQLGRPLDDDEKAAVAAKVKAMLGVA